jgi:hypothetical protein
MEIAIALFLHLNKSLDVPVKIEIPILVAYKNTL